MGRMAIVGLTGAVFVAVVTVVAVVVMGGSRRDVYVCVCRGMGMSTSVYEAVQSGYVSRYTCGGEYKI